MGESEKPFACPSLGCNMSFTNEDHLVVHKKKHDMILNFGSNKAGIFVADQTPTPTRFIRNCEEMGLFQDLQNDNPFEETFRRAVESGKLGSLPESEIGPSDDTLHTPQVFPHIENDQSSESRKLSSAIPDCPCEIEKNVTSMTIKKTTETVIIQEADTSAPPVIAPTSSSLSINGEEVQFLLKMDDGKLMPLSAIPVCGSNDAPSITTQPLKPQTIVIKTALPVKCPQIVESKKERLSLAKMKLKQVLSKNESSPDAQKTDQNENFEKSPNLTAESQTDKPQDIHKKQDILARNRASSMRARAKRKQWVQQLQKSMSNVNELNAVLELEIKSLRSEVAKLKTLLLAHKDCPVTKAMEKGNNILVEAHMIPVSSHFLTSPISLSNPIPPGKRKIPNELRKPAKRKPSVLLQKQSLLLPKLEDKNLPICMTKLIRNTSQQVKIVELSQVHEKRPKSLVILQNSSPRKVQSINSSQIVQLDQSLQLMNVASKSTGA